jgi:hypothetical protein
VVATHDIHCNSHNWPDAENGSSTPAESLTPGCDAQNLASFVVAASRANPVGDIRRGALGAGAQLGHGHDAVVSAAHALTASRRFSFRDTHKLLMLS